jgi:hypothetical protein
MAGQARAILLGPVSTHAKTVGESVVGQGNKASQTDLNFAPFMTDLVKRERYCSCVRSLTSTIHSQDHDDASGQRRRQLEPPMPAKISIWCQELMTDPITDPFWLLLEADNWRSLIKW